MEDRKCGCINLKYLPIKAHYFMFYGGMAGIFPFMQVLAKDLGISSTAVGIIYTVVPFCIFLAEPLFGYLADFFRNIKIVMLGVLVATGATFLGLLFVPPIETTKEIIQITALCTNELNEIIVQPVSNGSICPQDLAKQFKCQIISDCLKLKNIPGNLNISNYYPGKENFSFVFTLTSEEDYPSPQECDCLKANYSYISCDSNTFECNSIQNKGSEYETLTFGLYMFLAIVSGAGSSTIFCLSDAACNTVLGQNSEQFGRQRLWGTIGSGLVTFLAGYLNDVASKVSSKSDYSPGLYLMLGFVTMDLIMLANMQLVKPNISTNICKDVGKIYSSWHTVLFSFGVYINGAATGLVWNYEFWYLSDLGASQTLLGLVSTVQSLVAEVPSLFFSEWFIAKFGHFYCLIGAFAAFALRMGLYVIIKNPWFVLPVETLHGITFAIFYASMTLYATDYAPPGTEATMIGVLNGLNDGLGVATGSILGGIGFDEIGGRRTFFVASMICLTCVPFFTIAHILIIRYANLELTRTSSTSSISSAEDCTVNS